MFKNNRFLNRLIFDFFLLKIDSTIVLFLIQFKRHVFKFGSKTTLNLIKLYNTNPKQHLNDRNLVTFEKEIKVISRVELKPPPPQPQTKIYTFWTYKIFIWGGWKSKFRSCEIIRKQNIYLFGDSTSQSELKSLKYEVSMNWKFDKCSSRFLWGVKIGKMLDISYHFSDS